MATKKELRLYGDLVYQHKPTIKSILLTLLLDLLERRKRYKHPVNKDNISITEKLDIPKEMDIEFVHMALIQDGVVMEMIKTNQYTSKLLRSKKTKIVVFDPTKIIVKKGMNYSEKTFTENNEVDDGQED